MNKLFVTYALNGNVGNATLEVENFSIKDHNDIELIQSKLKEHLGGREAVLMNFIPLPVKVGEEK